MASIYVTLEFPSSSNAEIDAAYEQYKELAEVATDFGGSAATWKASEGRFSFRFRTEFEADRFQAEAVVPLAPGWAMRVGPL